ncbi:hypothetical protein A3D62_02765 [Candidatus Kaiserbacteria bacterium RIFCSPHIGHO2_02_FULL_49_11]|uniref:Ribonuclease n=1 Tax=Candidatus Kaiserbacteria bacterium RIFCSPHIGHO2_02_FULL_49_11 TaxID=1798489 RepID=A0A1F6D136_9BACT|nr:MAG: hypothetical protein A3D62_02765 [Candidatus Kaiserbacteria bacterium RIFCSPHIGHO2_02_FULL_49_11]
MGTMWGMKPHRYIIGIDEAGRGPIAGPVTVGAVLVPWGLHWRHFKGLKDSKQLTPAAREEWFVRLAHMEGVRYGVSSSSHATIDRKGIVYAVNAALGRALRRLGVEPSECLVLLDGGLHAPEEFMHQKTIIRGDESEVSIALASVVAKVTRDRRMVRLSKKYSPYDFHVHKGYGTKKHYALLHKHGLSDIHRRSFLSGIVETR